MSVLAGVVPTHAVIGVHRTGALCYIEVSVYRMPGVDQQEDVVLPRLGDTLDVEIDDVRNVDAPGVSFGLEFYGHVLDASEISSHGPPSFSGASHMTGENLFHGLPLLWSGKLVNIESRGPVALSHGARGVIRGQEIQPSQRDAVERAFFNVEGQPHITVPIGGLD